MGHAVGAFDAGGRDVSKGLDVKGAHPIIGNSVDCVALTIHTADFWIAFDARRPCEWLQIIAADRTEVAKM